MIPRSLLVLLPLFALLTPAASAQTPGVQGSFTLALTLSSDDPAKTAESKTEEAHEQAILAGQNSTRVTTWATRKQRIGNRQILELTLGTSDVRGWALIYLESEAHTGFVAYKKNTPPVPVPDTLLDFDNGALPFKTPGALFLEPTPEGADQGKSTDRFVASTATLTETTNRQILSVGQDLAVLDVPLNGLRTTRIRTTKVTPGSTFADETRSDRFTLFGGDTDTVYSGFATRTVRTRADITPYLPPAE